MDRCACAIVSQAVASGGPRKVMLMGLPLRTSSVTSRLLAFAHTLRSSEHFGNTPSPQLPSTRPLMEISVDWARSGPNRLLMETLTVAERRCSVYPSSAPSMELAMIDKSKALNRWEAVGKRFNCEVNVALVRL